MKKLDGKVAIITGSARGIGEAIARQFVAEGAAVVITDVLAKESEHVVDEITRQGGTAVAIGADVTKKAQIQRVVEETYARFKAIHILVNDAGITGLALITEMPEEKWDEVLEVDLKGVFLCTQAVLPIMMKQRYGKIINISSISGDGNFDPGMSAYAAAKGGVIQLTKVTAKEAGPYNINVNSIAPGSVLTDLTYSGRTKEYVEKHIENRKKAAALGRMGTREEIAKLALFLASDDSSFITGQLIRCDGGRLDRM